MSSAAKQLARMLDELGRVTDEPGKLTRTFLSPAMRRANARVGRWMRASGLSVREVRLERKALFSSGVLAGRVSAEVVLERDHPDQDDQSKADDGHALVDLAGEGAPAEPLDDREQDVPAVEG